MTLGCGGRHRHESPDVVPATRGPADQYRSWLSDGAPDKAMTVDQVRTAIGDSALDDLAEFLSGCPIAAASQLAAVLPDFVNAISPGGEVVDAQRLARDIAEAGADDDRSAGAFGSRMH